MVGGLGIEPSSTALQAVAEITRLAHPPKKFKIYKYIKPRMCFNMVLPPGNEPGSHPYQGCVIAIILWEQVTHNLSFCTPCVEANLVPGVGLEPTSLSL